jgi:hypothetical protein
MGKCIGQFSEEIQMTNKYMKKYSKSLAIKEMPIKTTLRFRLIPVRLAIIKKTNNNKCKCWRGWGGVGGGEPSYTIGGNVN